MMNVNRMKFTSIIFFILINTTIRKSNATPSMELNKRAVIIGAGPAGLSSAIMLVERGWNDITVIEKRSDLSFEDEKAYLYLIDGRGQRLTNDLNITSDIANNAVSNRNFKNITEIKPNGELEVKSIPIDQKSIEKFWIPRSRLLEVLINKINTLNAKSQIIKVHYGYEFQSIIQNDRDHTYALEVSRIDKSNHRLPPIKTIGADLFVGCDGINSKVRAWLQQQNKDTSERFKVTAFDSDAAGLLFKIIPIRDNFLVHSPQKPSTSNNSILPKNSDQADVVRTIPERAYAILGNKDHLPQSRLRMGLLPVKRGSRRTANFISKSNHNLWKISTVEEFKKLFQNTFPQIHPMESFFIEEELQAFVSAKPGIFPKPQYCNSLFHFLTPPSPPPASIATTTTSGISTRTSSPTSQQSTTTYGAGVVLLGDAAHCFPPDLGQGVNSALEDVYELSKSLLHSNNNLTTALPLYEKKRLPEIIALCKVMVFGYPYQYNQSPLKKKLCLANFALRILAHKILPLLFSPPSALMIQDHQIPYSEVLHRAHRTSRNLIGMVLLGILGYLIRFAKWWC